jgi:2-dehydro-3-deoxyphosphooctonate aldolase (KDO 8-P synthase)
MVEIGNIRFDSKNLVLIAGPCVIEDESIVNEVADELIKITNKLDMPFIFKTSYDKANRSSIHSYRGPGLSKGIKIFQKLKEKNILLLTDVHCKEEIKPIAEVVDVLQIPAFLSRQTDLITQAARYAKALNIKKGQFLSPYDMKRVIEKAEQVNQKNILITERGTCFGYNNLVVDFRSFVILQKLGYPVIFDATHSVQYPGSKEIESGGDREFIPYLAKAAVATGVIHGLFLEVHPQPEKALSDRFTQLKLEDLYPLLLQIKEIHKLIIQQ